MERVTQYLCGLGLVKFIAKYFHKTQAILRSYKRILNFLVVFLTICYGVGEYMLWLDFLSGRTHIKDGLEIFSTGTSTLTMSQHKNEFTAIRKIIEAHSENQGIVFQRTIKKLYVCTLPVIAQSTCLMSEIVLPTLPDGISVSPTFVSSSPMADSNDLQKSYMPDNTPLIFEYENGSQAIVASIGDIRDWTNESRDNERFIVLTVLIGVISLFAAIL